MARAAAEGVTMAQAAARRIGPVAAAAPEEVAGRRVVAIVARTHGRDLDEAKAALAIHDSELAVHDHELAIHCTVDQAGGVADPFGENCKNEG